MKSGSTWFLRAALVFMGLLCVVACIFAIPMIHQGTGAEFPGAETWLNIFTAGLYASVIPFVLALYQAWKLLNYIDQNQAFSSASVRALKNIKYCGIAVSICYAVGIPFLFHVASLVDPPGIRPIALAFTGAPLVIAVFAAVLEKLLQNAINIKSENDLTV